MKVCDVVPEPTKEEALKKLRAKIKSKAKNPAENEPNNGWNQDPHQGSTPGAFLYRQHMKVDDVLTKKENTTIKIAMHARKKKDNHNIKGDTKPHTSNIDTQYGMTGKGEAAVIQP